MRFRYTALCVALAVAAGLSATAIARATPPDLQKQIEVARAAEAASSDSEAVRLWTPLAEQGAAEAQAHLGMLYARGFGVYENKALAAEWLTKAADQGYVEAYADLGYLYTSGTGQFNDSARALSWYKKAADQGDAGAEETLARIYGQGKGVPQDDGQTYSWMKKAVEQRRKDGDIQSASVDAFLVGHMYAGDKDYGNAAAWYLIAANMGSLEAQDELGPMYENGVGVRRDYVAAYKWYALLAAYDKKAGLSQGPEVKAMKRLSAKMSSAQLRQARKLVQASNIVSVAVPPPVLTPVVQPQNCPAD